MKQHQGGGRREGPPLLEQVYGTVPVGLCFLDPDLRFVFVNDSLAAIHGRPVSEHIGRTLGEILRASGPLAESSLRQVIETGDPLVGSEVHTAAPAEPGLVREWLTHYYPLGSPEGRILGVNVVVQEITERMRSKTQLAMFSSLLENMQSGAMLETPERTVLAINSRLCNLFAIPDPPQTFLGGSSRAVTEQCRRLAVESHGFHKRADEIVRNLKEVTGEEIALKGGLVVERDYVPVIGPDQRVLGHAWQYRNITVRKRTEEALREKEVQLRQSQKLEAVGRLAGGVAHDFNNLLMVIIGYSELLMRGLEKENDLRDDAEQIWNTAERASALTRHLLAFSRKQSLQPKILEPNVMIRDMDKILRHLVRKDIEIVHVLSEELGRVEIDPSQLEQLIVNLVVNACDAMPATGRIVIETANIDLDGGYADGHVGVQLGPYVRLSVSDTGCGMDEQTRESIFDPFFTTKDHGKGTGLGLSTVYGIVKQTGGNIWVYSEPGLGTTFKIYLPRAEKAVEYARRILEPAEAPAGTETLLIVEDEDAVRRLVRDVLLKDGYEVLEAKRPSEALRVSEKHEGPIHLLLTDVVLPQMSGQELATRISSQRRETKTLFMSGYTAEAVAQHGVLKSDSAFVEKPISPGKVALKVREVLGDKPRLD